MDLQTFLNTVRPELRALANDPRVQFGPTTRRYLGAELLPERLVPLNKYTEYTIRFLSVIGNDATRYSPVQRKNGAAGASFEVSLAESQAGDEFLAADYDALQVAVRSNQGVTAQAALTRWTDRTQVRPLVEIHEKHRWEFLLDGTVKLRGNNNYREDIPAPVITGQRAAVGGDWSDPDYDPMDDLYERVAYQRAKGVTTRRIVTSTAAANKLLNHPKVAARFGRVLVGPAGALNTTGGRPTLAALNGILAEDQIPAIERYDLTYNTLTGTQRFSRADGMLFVGETELQEDLILNGAERLIVPSTLGYYAVGTVAGEPAPGRKVQQFARTEHPPRIEGEGVQTSYPVVQDVEAFAVLTGI